MYTKSSCLSKYYTHMLFITKSCQLTRKTWPLHHISSETPSFTTERVAKFENYNFTALKGHFEISNVSTLLIVRGCTTWSGIQKDHVKRQDEKSKWWLLFSPVFILRQSESIQKKLFCTEPLRETWPWGLPQNNFSQSLPGWGAFEVVIVLAETYWASFVHYDTSADGSRKCLVPNGILYWIQFMCVSACSGDL